MSARTEEFPFNLPRQGKTAGSPHPKDHPSKNLMFSHPQQGANIIPKTEVVAPALNMLIDNKLC
jgi:hypothetical protein